MRCLSSLLRATALSATLLPVMAWSQVALEVSLNPEEKMVAPFKVGQPILFLVKNNMPKQQTLTASVTGIEADIAGCETVDADSTCTLTVTPKQYGVFEFTVKTSTGRHIGLSDKYPVAYRLATYNLSFDRSCTKECSTDDGVTVQCKTNQANCPNGFDILKKQMALSKDDQQELIDKFRSGADMSDSDKVLAEAAIQIRNVAEVIQRKNPDVIVMGEFDNNGDGSDNDAIDDFQTNYLNVSQNNQIPLRYEFTWNTPTNTGKPSGLDLSNDGRENGPDDAWGHGFYHGQYAFAVFSKYPIDKNHYRSFQNFRWKDLPDASNPEIEICDDSEKLIPENRNCGDGWHSSLAWKQHPLSSKNHIDLPVTIPVAGTTSSETLHILASHPTPPIFDGAAKRNYKRNRDEIQFWINYIAGTSVADDGNSSSSLPDNAHFIIAGDLNADPDVGDGHLATIKALLNHARVNTAATTGSMRPTSRGGQEYLSSSECTRNCKRADGNTITSVSGLRLDHVIPSATLKVVGSGVFWPAANESGKHLVYDKTLGASKGVSSDHRLVWVDLYIPSKSTSGKTEL